MLRITPEAVAAIREHGREGYPLEICGFLVGSASDGLRTVDHAWPVRNAWEDDPDRRAGLFAAREAAGAARPEGTRAGEWEAASEERRYLVAPADILGAMKRAREAGAELVGVYHTHPDHPAVPSEFDRDAAWPEWSYIILSVREGEPADLRSWVLVEDGSRFEEEEIILRSPDTG